MTLLSGHRVVVLDSALDSALPRFLATLGASLVPVSPAEMEFQLGDASFLVEETGLPRLADLGWTRRRIEDAAPRLIHVTVTTFGSEAPRARWLGSELIASAMGGVLRLTGEPDRAPVKEALAACRFHADMVAAAGAMAAHFQRGVDGLGQHVDVSVQEVAFSRLVNSILVWQFDRRKLARVGGALNYGLATVRCIWPLADGFCFHTLMTGRFGAPANRALSDWINEVGMDNPLGAVDWNSYNRSTLAADTRAIWEHAIAAFFATRTKREIATEGRRRGINATVVAEPRDVLADAHLDARRILGCTRARQGCRKTRVPRRFVTVHAASPAPRAEAPWNRMRGEVTPGWTRRALSRGCACWIFLGPSWVSLTTKLLGDLGAEVIKVETRTRPCLTRIDVQVTRL